MERLQGTATPNGPGRPPWGMGSPAHAAVGAYGAPDGDGCPPRRGPTGCGDGESCPGGGRYLKSACGGWQPPKARGHQLGERGYLPKRWSGGLIPYLKGYLIPLPGFPTGRVPIGAGQISHDLHTIPMHSNSRKTKSGTSWRAQRGGVAFTRSTNRATPPVPGVVGTPSPSFDAP